MARGDHNNSKHIHLNLSQTGWYSISYPGGMKGWVDLGHWLHTEMVHPPTDSQPFKYQHGNTRLGIKLTIGWSQVWCPNSKQSHYLSRTIITILLFFSAATTTTTTDYNNYNYYWFHFSVLNTGQIPKEIADYCWSKILNRKTCTDAIHNAKSTVPNYWQLRSGIMSYRNMSSLWL